jgi:hypothetical protein
MAVRFIQSDYLEVRDITTTVDINIGPFIVSGLSNNAFIVAVIAMVDIVEPAGLSSINYVRYRNGLSGETPIDFFDLTNEMGCYTAFLDPSTGSGNITFNVTPYDVATVVVSAYLFDNVHPTNYISELNINNGTAITSTINSSKAAEDNMTLSLISVNCSSQNFSETVTLVKPQVINTYVEAIGTFGQYVTFGSALQNGIIGGVRNHTWNWSNSLPYSHFQVTLESDTNTLHIGTPNHVSLP